MDSRTRVRNAIERRPLDRIPRYDSFWEDTLTAWREQGLPADVDPAELFGWDMRMMYMDASMRLDQKVIESDDTFIVYQDQAGYTVRKYVGKSRALEWLDHVTKDRAAWNRLRDRFAFDPDALSRVDTESYFAHMNPYPTWAEAKRRFDALRATGKYLCFVVYGPWESTWRHRGYTELLMDLVVDPLWATEMADAQTQLVQSILEHCRRLDMKPDAVWLIDDLACSRGMLFSPEVWRRIFKPMYRRLGRFLHDQGISFWLHCCGNCGALLDDLVECELQVLQPLQAQAGMDVRELKPTYGEALTFWGNIDVRKMSGPPEECERELRDKITAAKEGGGYMYHSDHSIPPEVTFERYQWIMECVDKYGRY